MNRYEEILSRFYGNRLLFGDPAEPSVLAVERASSREVEIFRRRDGGVTSERRPIRLFVLIAERGLMDGFGGAHTLTALDGDFRFKYLAEFDDADMLEAARRHLRQASGRAGGAPDAPWFALTDPIEQHLMLTGITHYLGIRYGDLRRMQLDIETITTPGFEFPAAAREGDRIIAIALRDSDGFERVIRGDQLDERAMLGELVRIVRERDPDVIEGHNLFRFDLEYIEERARRWRVKLALGRGGGVMRARASRLQIAERAIAYRRYDIYGRSIIDTWILAQHYDIASRELEGFGLKELAIHFGLARADRVYLDASRMAEHFERRPGELFEYALDDVRETGALAEILTPGYFIQAQIFPYSLQNAALRGNATKIDALLMRAYLTARHSLPAPAAPTEVAGGHTEVRRVGVARNVLHCDVTSLYPSLMIEGRHAPASDRLGVFLRLLEDLRGFRVAAKTAAHELQGAARRDLEALQQTFKILINSFYGYLGFSLGHFNDFAQANEVTRRGRALIQRAVAELEARGARVIEVDTDGIYFVAPFAIGDEAAARALIEEIGAAMPAGIRLEIDGRYPAMFSYKMKNYVLLDERGELTVRGSGLKSRGLERFQRRFMAAMFRLLLADRRAEIAALRDDFSARIERHEIGIAELMKTETLQDSPAAYRDKIGGKRRNVSAAYELALRAERPYQSGDQISYYVTGRGARVKVAEAAKMAADYDPARPDENVPYYQAKLADLYEKFRPFIERDGLFAPDAETASAEQAEIFPGAGDKPAE